MADARTSSHGPQAGFVHEALMYRDDAEFDAAMHAFLQEAAAASEPVMIALPGSHLRHVRETLGDAIFDGISGSPLGDLSGLIQDPGERGFGPLSGGLNGVPAPLGTELACLVNVVYLQGGGGSLPNGL